MLQINKIQAVIIIGIVDVNVGQKEKFYLALYYLEKVKVADA